MVARSGRSSVGSVGGAARGSRWLVGPVSDVDLDGLAHDAHGEAGDRKAVGIAGTEAGADIEGQSVGTADDDAVAEPASAQGKTRVGAGVLHRMDLVTDAIESDRDLADDDPEPRIVGNLFESGDGPERQAALLAASVDGLGS